MKKNLLLSIFSVFVVFSGYSQKGKLWTPSNAQKYCCL